MRTTLVFITVRGGLVVARSTAAGRHAETLTIVDVDARAIVVGVFPGRNTQCDRALPLSASGRHGTHAAPPLLLLLVLVMGVVTLMLWRH